ncbi:MAG: cyclase family protein [Candidatus Baldrarchaeia archaeon]
MLLRIIDVTKPIEDKRKYYPTLPPARIDFLHHYSLGYDHWVSSINLPLHSATHVDAPARFFSDGKRNFFIYI